MRGRPVHGPWPWQRIPFLAARWEQGADFDVEAGGEAEKLVERRVRFASFDAAHVATGHSDVVGESFLADVRCGAYFTDAGTEGGAVGGGWLCALPPRSFHASNVGLQSSWSPRYI